MFSYTTQFKDAELYVKPRQFVGGVAIGIILFGQTGYALPPGSVENATSFKYPVYYRAIAAASVESVVSPNLNPKVLEQLIQTGREMQDQGCRAIVGACGYFANYLPEITRHLDVPCFFSSLMQVPMILQSMRPGRKVGVICADGRVLSSAPALRNCGVSDPAAIVIAGAEVLPDMKKILTGAGHYNPVRLEEGLVGLAGDLIRKHPEIGAFLLECTLFPAHARAVQESVRLPVFDFSTLIDWVYSGVVRRSFGGYI
jgi:hypothetical protein